MSREVLLTGASGGLGSYLVPRLIDSGWAVMGLSRTRPEWASSFGANYRHVTSDLFLPPANHYGDIPVINAAAVTRDGKDKWIVDANIALTKHALALSRGPVVHISSSSVYDLSKPTINASEGEATGRYPFLNAYSAGKFHSEQLVKDSGRDAITLRPHAVYGETDNTLVPRLKRAVRNGQLFLPLSASPVHQFTSMSNLANATLLALEALIGQAGRGVRLCNVTDREPFPVMDAIKIALANQVRIRTVPTSIADTVAHSVEILARSRGVEPRLSRYAVAQLSMSRTYDLSAAQSLLGYAPEPTKIS